MGSGDWLLPSAQRQMEAILGEFSVVDLERPGQLARQLEALESLFEAEVRWAFVASRAVVEAPPPSWLIDAALARLEERFGSISGARRLSFVATIEQLPAVAKGGRWAARGEDAALFVWQPEGLGKGRDDALGGMVAPALEERCGFELRLALGEVVDAFVEALVESVAEPTWLVRDDSGAVLACNSAARSDPRATDLRGALDGADGFRVQELSSQGAPATYLITRIARDDVEVRAARAGRSWGLSPRQREVLALLVEGETNRRIAERLDISPRTAETHVAEVLRRAGAPNRVALVRAFWEEP